MLRNCHICLSLGSDPHPSNVIFLRANGISINCHSPYFCIRPTSFDGPNTISNRPRDIIHLLPCRMPCRFFFHSSLFWSLKQSTVNWTWTISSFLTNK
jgi:hypothetical protein